MYFTGTTQFVTALRIYATDTRYAKQTNNLLLKLVVMDGEKPLI